MRVRPPAVSGYFYPDSAHELRRAVHDCLPAMAHHPAEGVPTAIIVPHAGYEYSGPVAGSAYALVRQGRGTIARVVLIGPSHRTPLRGLAVTSHTHFTTPLGAVEVDRDAVCRILRLPQVHVLDDAHANEHSLEVHLPFLQETLVSFRIVPLVVGDASAEDVGEVIEALWGGPDTLVIVSSDLSHYHEYETARRVDARTSAAIASLDFDAIDDAGACGAVPIRGLLWAAKRKRLQVRVLDVRCSGDTAGPREQVVGYGAFAFTETLG